MTLYEHMWDLNDVYSSTELASELGISRTAFSNLVARHDNFPTELATIGGRRVWSLHQVATWYFKHQEARNAA